MCVIPTRSHRLGRHPLPTRTRTLYPPAEVGGARRPAWLVFVQVQRREAGLSGVPARPVGRVAIYVESGLRGRQSPPDPPAKTGSRPKGDSLVCLPPPSLHIDITSNQHTPIARNDSNAIQSVSGPQQGSQRQISTRTRLADGGTNPPCFPLVLFASPKIIEHQMRGDTHPCVSPPTPTHHHLHTR